MNRLAWMFLLGAFLLVAGGVYFVNSRASSYEHPSESFSDQAVPLYEPAPSDSWQAPSIPRDPPVFSPSPVTVSGCFDGAKGCRCFGVNGEPVVLDQIACRLLINQVLP